MIKIIADAAIPLIKELFGSVATIELIPGQNIKPHHVHDADALFVRSITRVDQHLLRNSSVKFVGTMTAGIDHVDREWLQKQNITFANAQGANARAVAQYVVACIAYLQTKQQLPLNNCRAGIIGIGHVGRLVSQLLQTLGIEVVLNDPPRALQDPRFTSTPLHEFENLDLVSVHTSLTYDEPYPSYHLINEHFLKQQKPHCILINTSRGEACDSLHLRNNNFYCFDVWENEPNIALDFFLKTTIATPHIAGYTWQAKFMTTLMVYQAAERFFQWNKPLTEKDLIPYYPCPPNPLLTPQNTWQEMVLQVYNPKTESDFFKKELAQTSSLVECYENFRRYYAFRHEFNAFTIPGGILPDVTKNILKKLGFNLS